MNKCLLCGKDLEKDFAAVSAGDKFKVCFDCFFEDFLKNRPANMDEYKRRVNERVKEIEEIYRSRNV